MKSIFYLALAICCGHPTFASVAVGGPHIDSLPCTSPDGTKRLGAVTTLEVTTQPVNPSGNVRKVEIVRQIVSFPLVTRRELLQEIFQDVRVAKFESVNESRHVRVELDKEKFKAEIFAENQLSWVCESPYSGQ